MSSSDEFSAGEDFYCDLPEIKHHPIYKNNPPVVDDSNAVAEHYNARPNLLPKDRVRSPIIHLREFNNWIKSVLIREFVSQRNLKVLDLACGKGGDLYKWDKASVAHVTGIDIAQISVDHAKERYRSMRNVSFKAEFIAYDAFNKPFTKGLLPLRYYDAISCQFAFHYSFSTRESAINAVANVASVLSRGGYFFGTIPDAQEIRRRLQDPELCTDERTIKNRFYELKMDLPVSTKHDSPFGIRYEFSLIDAVDSCPEYIVPFGVLTNICQDHGMELILEASLPTFYQNFSQIPEYQELLNRMNIMTDEGLILSDDERDVACKLWDHLLLCLLILFFYHSFIYRFCFS